MSPGIILRERPAQGLGRVSREFFSEPRAAANRRQGFLAATSCSLETLQRRLPNGAGTRNLGQECQSRDHVRVRQRGERVRVVTERKSPAELTISTMHPGSKNTDAVIIKYEIHVPRESKLTIHRATGSVFVIGLTSNIEVECSRGDIQLMLRDSSAYSIDAASKLDTVISDFEGTTKLRRYRLGERYATANTQSPPGIYLRMGFGGITIKAVPPEAYSTFSAIRADADSASAGSRKR
jgi:hypothetical protein